MSSALIYQPVHQLSEQIQSRKLSPVDLVDAYLDNIRQKDQKLQAFVDVYDEDARLAAKAADEAIRSGSLAAMTLMLAAKGQGLVSTPMIGFDQSAVAKEFGLSGEEVPVMLITVGYPGAANWPQKPRKPVSDVLQFV